ncbi:hypothetical protein GDO78_008388 [Eleutherodactylus coqui]|uniref:Neuregulin 3 n=1 Tax=Eleutherodactylus coqui TaxID=57060 RepID=A0A8J6FD71_ELECQ|nr:hypothetical protein GDO78_008388 [Eleutherodactylus coqui]
MESEEVYQQQILSISCIVFGIVSVGLICAAFYCRTKRQTKVIQEQLKDVQNGNNYSIHASSLLSKAKNFGESRVQLHSYSNSERNPEPIRENVMESSFSETLPFSESTVSDRGTSDGNGVNLICSRSLSTCCSPSQRSRMLQRNAFRRTPPLPRGRLNGITGPAYQQLEEPGLIDQDTIPCQGCSSTDLTQPQNSSINMQLRSKETQSYFNNMDQKDSVSFSTSRASSIPIIPSVELDDACLQMQNVPGVSGIKLCKNSYSSELMKVNITPSNCLIAEQKEVKILLETVQEQIQILTDARRRSEDMEITCLETEESASENTAFLPLSPKAKIDPEAQFVLRNEMHRDSMLHV